MMTWFKEHLEGEVADIVDGKIVKRPRRETD
jgi:hypothetical protein